MRLRYWVKNSFVALGSTIGACALYTAMMLIQLYDLTWEMIWMMAPVYLIVFGGIMDLALGMSLYKVNVGLCLSFGSTRREALAGLQIYRLLPTVLVAALAGILSALGGLGATGTIVLCTLGLYLATGAIGSLMGIMYMRFGKWAAIVTAILFVFIGIGGGVLGFLGASEMLGDILNQVGIGWMALAVGVLVYGLMLIPEVRTVKKYQVKM